MKDEVDYSLIGHNTFGIAATAARYIEYDSVAELKEFIASGALTEPYLHIGQGSNLLFTRNYPGTILHSRIKGKEVMYETDDDIVVRVGGGEIWDEWVAYCVNHQWYGAENLSLIPGEVGAGAVQNIGAYGIEVKDIIQCVETVDAKGEDCIFTNPQCQYSYRQSIFKRPDMKRYFVTYVTFRLKKKECYHLDYGSIRAELAKYTSPNLDNVRQAIISIRSNKLPDPQTIGNAGSFFMNPIISRKKFEQIQKSYPDIPFYELDAFNIKVPAGWMIEQCGWKGKSLGPVAVYDKQALILVNRGGASGKDVVALSDAIRQSVFNKFNIDIHPEVNFI
ncbi:MAG: UDP-N-acetylmuramate dehydrogenase [Bacteroidales bacterium]|nr:UDP-N-acetylmuramate dehydrogenase [Bacteroidales bacterium]